MWIAFKVFLAFVTILLPFYVCFFLLGDMWALTCPDQVKGPPALEGKVILKKINLFSSLAALGLRCCMKAFSSCGERGLLSSCDARASPCGSFSCLQSTGSGDCGLQSLWRLGFIAPLLVGSSRTRDQTHLSCIGRWILNHWATREVLKIFLIFNILNITQLPF